MVADDVRRLSRSGPCLKKHDSAHFFPLDCWHSLQRAKDRNALERNIFSRKLGRLVSCGRTRTLQGVKSKQAESIQCSKKIEYRVCHSRKNSPMAILNCWPFSSSSLAFVDHLKHVIPKILFYWASRHSVSNLSYTNTKGSHSWDVAQA